MMVMVVAGCCGVGGGAAGGTARGGEKFRVFVITSMAKDHQKMIAAAMPVLHRLGRENGFGVDITNDGEAITEEKLRGYQVVVMLQEAPFDVPAEGQKAIEKFVEAGGGWVGIHAAGLPSREYTAKESAYWGWYEKLMGGEGGIQYRPHPAYQKARLVVEDRGHAATKELPGEMWVSDEWYEFDHSVRGRKGIRVLASVDEGTYKQNVAMGDHPMIWVE